MVEPYNELGVVKSEPSAHWAVLDLDVKTEIRNLKKQNVH